MVCVRARRNMCVMYVCVMYVCVYTCVRALARLRFHKFEYFVRQPIDSPRTIHLYPVHIQTYIPTLFGMRVRSCTLCRYGSQYAAKNMAAMLDSTLKDGDILAVALGDEVGLPLSLAATLSCLFILSQSSLFQHRKLSCTGVVHWSRALESCVT